MDMSQYVFSKMDNSRSENIQALMYNLRAHSEYALKKGEEGGLLLYW